ncbi:MAG TPA: hypothetical protein VGF06_12330 [Terriglobales bacterium]
MPKLMLVGEALKDVLAKVKAGKKVMADSAANAVQLSGGENRVR